MIRLKYKIAGHAASAAGLFLLPGHQPFKTLYINGNTILTSFLKYHFKRQTVGVHQLEYLFAFQVFFAGGYHVRKKRHRRVHGLCEFLFLFSDNRAYMLVFFIHFRIRVFHDRRHGRNNFIQKRPVRAALHISPPDKFSHDISAFLV